MTNIWNICFNFFHEKSLAWFFFYSWRPLVEIFIIAIAIYYISVFVRGTRTEQLLKGFVFVVIVFIISQKLEFFTIYWILSKIFGISVLAFLIIFQPELRRFFIKIGQNKIFAHLLREENLIDEIVKALLFLSKKRIGTLLVIEQNMRLGNYTESGIVLDSVLSSDLITTLFMPTTVLHEGSVIVRGNRIVAAKCLLPLSENPIQQKLGTRHRAALGLSEETDAVVLVVSEETGIISLVHEGQILRDLGEKSLINQLQKLFSSKENKGVSG